MTHTPGPWAYSKTGNMAGVYPINEKGKPRDGRETGDVCTIGTLSDYDWKADAALITAAPDLLRALQRLVGLVDAYQTTDLRGLSDHDAVKEARKLLAKVTP